MANIKILHILAPGCHAQAVCQNKRTQVQHANRSIASPLIGIMASLPVFSDKVSATLTGNSVDIVCCVLQIP